MKPLLGLLTVLALTVPAIGTTSAQAADKPAKVVLIAGRASHGPGEHEFNAGTKLLEKWLKETPGIEPVFVAGGWPKDESVFDGAKSVVFFMDGGDNHPMFKGPDRFKIMDKLMRDGVGLVCIHYAVEFPKGRVGDTMLNWLGGYYETGYSDNPHNNVTVQPKEGHPTTRGVGPFKANDEWYFKIRFAPDDPRVTPVLTAKNLVGHDKKTYTEPETVAWATERKDGGRSFGFTGAHFHKNWAIPEFRKLLLNAIVWTAKLEVPSDGVKSELAPDEIEKNLDPKRR